MKLGSVILLAAVFFCLPAEADYKTVDYAYEVPLNLLTVPRTSNGTLRFRTCGHCDVVTGRLTNQTRFEVNDVAVELKEFHKSVFGIVERSDEIVTVIHHLESDTIQLISISPEQL